jgi:hypothetical protein
LEVKYKFGNPELESGLPRAYHTLQRLLKFSLALLSIGLAGKAPFVKKFTTSFQIWRSKTSAIPSGTIDDSPNKVPSSSFDSSGTPLTSNIEDSTPKG